jgi:hypothetical protein
MIKNIMKNIGLKEIVESNEKLLDRRRELIAKGERSPEENVELKDITEKIQKNNSSMQGGNYVEEARKKLLELEKARKSKTDSLEDNKVRLEQAGLLEAAGFNTRADFDEYVKENETAK